MPSDGSNVEVAVRRSMTVRARRWTLCAFLLLLGMSSRPLAPTVRGDALQTVPIVLHVAERAGEPVADEAFVRTQLQHADAIYRKLGVALALKERRRMAARHAEIIDRTYRDELGAQVVAGALNWFVVAKLMDVDEPGRERRGVHWRMRGAKDTRYVIVSAISGPYVLAHELGHFFGNPVHSDVPGNLMSYQLTDDEPVLDVAQRANVLRALRALRRSGTLRTR